MIKFQMFLRSAVAGREAIPSEVGHPKSPRLWTPTPGRNTGLGEWLLANEAVVY